MESKRGTQSYEAFPMNGGRGEYSYAQNSTNQRRGTDMTKNIIKEAILEKLDLETLLENNSSSVVRIADLGCSVGPNTFFTVQNIVDAVNLKLQFQGHDLDKFEIHVFFNDHVGNDFNTLFESLPVNKQYYAAGLPGSFHGRLFPKSSIHIFNSSYALTWLSRAPIAIVNKNSPAYNKGKFYFTSDDKEVEEAYSAQFARDMESFLNSRALELVSGGIMALLIPCVPPNAMDRIQALANLMGDTLVDLTSKGIISEELVDSFNLPIYIPASEEVEGLIESNGNFRIERSEALARLINNTQESNVHVVSMHLRVAWEGLFKSHFGEEVVDEIFEFFEKKLAESSILTDSILYKSWVELFVIQRQYI